MKGICSVQRRMRILEDHGSTVYFIGSLTFDLGPIWLTLEFYQRDQEMYRKATSIRQAPVFRHLGALRKNPWKIIIWMNEL